ncbi:MAG: DUF4900 domain-containing protein [Candidatus Omnitrophica bacterium]|nr:DUF4900 domain-containing protein [Candidatus Omnitrophota bacterium]
MILKNKKGMALILGLFLLTLLMGFATLLVLRTVNENKIATLERNMNKALYLAEAGTQKGLYELSGLINTHVRKTAMDATPNTFVNTTETKVTQKDNIGWLFTYSFDGQTQLLTKSGSNLIYPLGSTNFGDGTYQINIVISKKPVGGDPITVKAHEKWKFPYAFTIQSTGTVAGVTRKVKISGDFTVNPQKDNFAKYALFTDHQYLPGSQDPNQVANRVWFNKNTFFTGPMHSNDQFNFAGNPGPVFYNDLTHPEIEVDMTQHLSKAWFYNNNNKAFQADASSNLQIDTPVFYSTYTRGEDLINLESSIQKADLSTQATYGGGNVNNNGIYIPNDGTKVTGGIYINRKTGNNFVSIQMAADNNGKATYTVVENGTTKNIIVDTVNKTTKITQSGKSDINLTGMPNGKDGVGVIIYAQGQIDSLSGTVQKNSQVTISGDSDIIITNHIQYQVCTASSGTLGQAGYIPPHVDMDEASNLLGILSWGGNIRIGTTAPDNLNVQAILMARNGIVAVDNYDDQNVGPRGTVNLLGGVISDFYGAFNTFNNSGLVSGYGRNFNYDDRTLLGQSPPYFPSLNTFIAYTTDIADKLVWQEGGF